MSDPAYSSLASEFEPGLEPQPELEIEPEVAQPPEPRAERSAGVAPGPVAAARARPIPRINIQAFCEDRRTGDLLTVAAQDRRLSKVHVTVQMGGMDAAAAFYRNAPTPNLIVVESLHQREALLADLDRLAEVCDSGTKVVVIGHINDVLLYRELLHQGVSEYLVMPFTVSEVMECLSSIYNDPKSEPVGNIVAFIGAKGGAGSSTVCHNTAWAISEAVRSEAVIADFDLPFGTAGLDFNQDPVQGLADALNAPERLDEVLLDRLLSRCSDYLSLFAAPGTLDHVYDIDAEASETVLDVVRANFPFVAVDLPHMWTSWSRHVAVLADHVVVTAAPELASLRNAKNMIDKLKAARPNDSPPHLVLNQVGLPKRPEIPVKDFAAALEMAPSAVIDFDAALFGTAANNGQMISEVSARSKAAEQFRELAFLLGNRAEQKAESASLLAPILSRLNLSIARA